MKKNIFIFDQNKCVACHACVVACMNENDFQLTDQWRNIHKSQEFNFPPLPLYYLSLACNHCDDAPCLKNCPALAYSRNEITGAIIHDPNKCIGCKYCTWACPYDAPKFNFDKGIIEKCNFCTQRIEDNLKPACVNSCPTGALDFTNTEFTRQESNDSSPVLVDIGSHLKIHKLRKNTGPEMDLALFENQPDTIKQNNNFKKISAKKEWLLIIFTLLSVFLVSLNSSTISSNFTLLHKNIFLGIAFVATILSIMHLGKKNRAWRSLTNIKNSWLSKEIAFFTLYFVAVFFDFYLINLPNLLISAIGLIFLFSIDMLYRIANWKWILKIHSAQTILIGISLLALLNEWHYLLIFIISFRLTIYIYRKYSLAKNDWIISLLRILFPIIAIILMSCSREHYISLVLIAIGEIIDRIEFYNELNVPNPKLEFSLNN